MSLTLANIVRFDCYEVDLRAGQLHKHGIKINLRDKSFQVLVALLEHPGEVVTREDLRRQLWREEVFVDFDNNLNTAIARLREALCDSADHPRFIETLPKRGYRFLESVSEFPRTPEKRTAKRARVIVLPFVNLSGDPAQEYFSDAMTDEIITEFAKLAPEQLAVIARTTAMHYKGSHKDVSRIGRELGVDYVVEGGVRRTGDQVAINVQLIQTSDQTHLFAKKYNAELRDIFNVQSCIAQDIATPIDITTFTGRVRPEGVVAGRAARKPTDDLASYDAYIRGRYHLYRWTPEGIAKAKQLFEEAVARDPSFALAYDALAETYWHIGFLGFARPRDAFSAGVFPALRALEIDHMLAETHALLAMFRKELDYNWPEVQREMALALDLDPASPVVRFRYALSGLMPQGHIDEAVAQLERVLESDPLAVMTRMWLGEIMYLGRQYERVREQCRLMKELDPAYFLSYFELGEVGCEQGAFGEAISDLRKAAELSGNAPLVLGWLGMALAKSGDVAGAREVLAGLHAAATQVYVPPTSFAWIHLGLGEIDQAFTWMERAIDERDPIIVPIKSYPFLDPLRDDPRFHALLRKMNLET
jgi:TolB-like protein/tetratricopeptide (TPR) repeat protein